MDVTGGGTLAAALDYAGRGWHVLPVHDIAKGHCSCLKGDRCLTPGKHPRLDKWDRWATTDAGTIAGWWKHWPTANVGIKTGAESGIVVLDVDPRNGGSDTLLDFIAE